MKMPTMFSGKAMVPEVPDARMRAPAAIRPAFIASLFEVDADGQRIPDEALSAIQTGLTAALRESHRLSELREALENDPTLTPGAAELKIRDGALRLGERAAAELDKARDLATSILKRLETTTLPQPAATEARVNRILDRFSRMDDKTRAKEIDAAVADGRGHVIGTLLAFDDFESGIGRRERMLCELGWRQAHHPKEHARMTRIRDGLEALELGGQGLTAFVQEIASSPVARKAEAQQQRSQAAQAAIVQSLDGATA